MADQKIAPPIRLVDTSGGTTNTAVIDSSGNLTVKLNSVGSVTVPVSGAVTANIGTSGSLALDTSVNGLFVAQGTTTSGGKGGLVLGAVTTSAPTYTNGQSHPLSLTPSGLLRVDGSSGTFPISGSIQDSQTIADNTAFSDGSSKLFAVGFIYDEVAGTALTENDIAAARINVNRASVNVLEDGTTRGRYATVTASNALKVDGSAVTQPVSGTFWQATQPVSGTVTANAGTGTFAISASSLPLPTGAATAAKQPALGTAGSASTDVITVQGIASGTALNVAVVSGGGNDTPSSPVAVYAKTTDLAAGASTTTAHQTSDLAAGTFYCAGFDVSSSIPLKAALHTVLNGTQSTNPLVVVFAPAGGFAQWKPPHRTFAPFTSANAAGFDGFRLVLTNMDGSEAADVYSTIYYQSN